MSKKKTPVNLSASYSLTLRIKIAHEPGMLAKVTAAIGKAGGLIGAVDIVASKKNEFIREISVNAYSAEHAQEIADAIKGIEKVELLGWTDRTFQVHIGGKITMQNRYQLKTHDDLSMAYTPGVARVCTAIQKNPALAFRYTIKSNCVAVVSDGTAVLGLGDIGPEAAMPVMEGKCCLFKEFGGIDAFPICLATKDTEEIIAIVKALAPTFGGINLEDISSPRCFEIEERLKAELDIPIIHDDQHGTAIVVLAAFYNSLRLTGKDIGEVQVALTGTGAAGIAVTKILLNAGVKDVIGCDRKGILCTEREDYPEMSAMTRWYAENTNTGKRLGTPVDALDGADLFIGLSGPGAIQASDLSRMNEGASVFAMANPTPEVSPEEAAPYVRIIATGRSDYPNQINNVLAFPGLFRGAFDAHATKITEGMKLVAARAIADVIPESSLSEDYIIPSVFNKEVAAAVASAVAEEARRAGVTRES